MDVLQRLQREWFSLADSPVNADAMGLNLAARQEIHKLRARVAELEKDRERLDWLESVGDDFTSWLEDDGTTIWDYSPDGKAPVGGSKVSLRQAIDAAMNQGEA